MSKESNDFPPSSANERRNKELERGLTSLFEGVSNVQKQFMKHPQRDTYFRPLNTGFELPSDTILVATGSLISRTYSKTEELTSNTEGNLETEFLAEQMELSIVGKPDLDAGFYEGFGLNLVTGDIVATLISRPDSDDNYKRVIVKYSEVAFSVMDRPVKD